MGNSQFSNLSRTHLPLRPALQPMAGSNGGPDSGPRSGTAGATGPGPAKALSRDTAVPRLVACVDDGEQAATVSAQSLAIARSLGLAVTFARVIDAPSHFSSPADPIEWQLRQRSQRANLKQLTEHDVNHGTERDADRDDVAALADCVLLAGAPADELSDWAKDHGATMLALGRRRNETSRGLGSTAQALLDRAVHSLLLVPPEHAGSHDLGPEHANRVTYSRIIVPIDGSARAESVLPIARRIARTHGAELILVHIVPRLEVVGAQGVPKMQDLRAQIERHNERTGRSHLEDLRRRSVEEGVAVRTIIAGPGDPRTQLRDIAVDQQADLIVMASHGNSGLEDVACGSVTEYLAGHAPIPLLIVRPNIRCRFASEPESSLNASAFPFI